MEDSVKGKLLRLEPSASVILTVSKEGLEYKYQGFCTLFREQHNDWTENDYICLTDAVDIIQDIKSIKPHFFSIPNVLNVEVMPSSVNNSKTETDIRNDPIEYILPTTVITERRQLESWAETLRDIEILGFSFEGENIGRFGTVKWINLLMKKTIVALHVEPLSMQMGGENNLWSKLQSAIFSNSSLVKVVFDVRAAADFLFHQHGISLSNVFDIMVAEMYCLETTSRNDSKPPDAFKSLSECLQQYLPDEIHPAELRILREYENDTSIHSNWLLNSPPPNVLKVGAIRIKYLLRLREELRCKLMEGYRNVVSSRITSVLSM